CRGDEVLGGGQFPLRDRTQVSTDRTGVARCGIEAGADRSTTEVDPVEQRVHVGDAVLFLTECGVPGAELLADGHRYRVLELRAADLHEVTELGRFLGQGL